jgi:hypothetical protein
VRAPSLVFKRDVHLLPVWVGFILSGGHLQRCALLYGSQCPDSSRMRKPSGIWTDHARWAQQRTIRLHRDIHDEVVPLLTCSVISSISALEMTSSETPTRDPGSPRRLADRGTDMSRMAFRDRRWARPPRSDSLVQRNGLRQVQVWLHRHHSEPHRPDCIGSGTTQWSYPPPGP